jgi:hypothetical protein
MSSTASNYDMPKLLIGQSIASLAALLGVIAAFPTLSDSLKSSSPFICIILLYGIMMFASSYVEEEQHFWYWAATAWLVLLSIKGYVSLFIERLDAYKNIARGSENPQVDYLLSLPLQCSLRQELPGAGIRLAKNLPASQISLEPFSPPTQLPCG